MSNLIYNKKLPIGYFQVFDDKPLLDNIIHVHQVHSADIEPYIAKDISSVKSDGIIIDLQASKNIHLAIKTADCLPILLIGEKGLIFLHAGWAGLHKNILKHQSIISIEPYYCFIGPSIHLKNFEVQEDFYQHFPGSDNFHTLNNKLYFDLQAETKKQLTSLYSGIEIEESQICTYEDLKFNSYRRDKTSQRNWNIFSFTL